MRLVCTYTLCHHNHNSLPLHHDNDDCHCDETLLPLPSLPCYNQQDNEGDDDNEAGQMEDNKNNSMSNDEDGCGECVNPPSITITSP
jgi:hypothetical protein